MNLVKNIIKTICYLWRGVKIIYPCHAATLLKGRMILKVKIFTIILIILNL